MPFQRHYVPTEKARVTRPIQLALERRNETHTHKAWCEKLAGGPFQSRGLPDLLVIYRGWPIFFETKRLPGMKGTALQEWTMRRLRKAGAVAFVPPTADDALKVLDQIDAFEDGTGPYPTFPH